MEVRGHGVSYDSALVRTLQWDSGILCERKQSNPTKRQEAQETDVP